MSPGARNLITDVGHILVGNAEDRAARSGTTVVLCERPCVAGVDVRGGAPGTRETDLLDPTNLVDTVDAVVLCGGSAFGLDAASGAMHWLAGQGRGFAVGPARVPIVPAAVLFDLNNGGVKDWGAEPPYRALGRAACAAAAKDFALGNAGAGLGARAGAFKGGLGSASVLDADGLAVGALVAANPVGSPVMGDGPTLWAWPFELDGEMGHQRPPLAPVAAHAPLGRRPLAGGATTIAVVATNAELDAAGARRVAMMAQDGIARAIRPAHTPWDGDTVFALATGAWAAARGPEAIGRAGAMAADCLARAVGRAIVLAEDLGDMVSWRTRFP
ncbi:MAG: P1 family peptidase [Alphaproteobacteria bacterium]|nr:P1 family peptidase [Alphaproteobacteria bacterium]